MSWICGGCGEELEFLGDNVDDLYRCVYCDYSFTPLSHKGGDNDEESSGPNGEVYKRDREAMCARIEIVHERIDDLKQEADDLGSEKEVAQDERSRIAGGLGKVNEKVNGLEREVKREKEATQKRIDHLWEADSGTIRALVEVRERINNVEESVRAILSACEALHLLIKIGKVEGSK